MDRSPLAPATPIRPDRPLRLQDGAGRRVTVLHGKVWISQDGDPVDRLLVAGDDVVLDRPGLALVSALEDEAQVAVAGPGAAPARAPETFWSRLLGAHRAAVARATLHAMRDRELQDIGLCRSQIEFIGR